MCFLNLAKALFMSPSWATWAILIAPAVVFAVWVVVKRQNGVGGGDGDSPTYGAAGASWEALGWTMLLTALVFYLVDVGLFFGGKTQTQNGAFEQTFIRQSAKTQGPESVADGFQEVLGSLEESESAGLLAEQGRELKTGADRRSFLQAGGVVTEGMLKKGLAKLPGMAMGKRKEWLDTRHYTELLGDLSQNEWNTLLGALGKGDGVAGTLLTALISDDEFEGKPGLWEAVLGLSPLPQWMKVACQSGCMLQANLVKFFITALGFLRGVVWLLLWLGVGLGMVLAGGGMAKESQYSLYEKLPA